MSLDLRAIDDETARQLMLELAGLHWEWRPDELPALHDRFGWTIDYTGADGATIGSTPWPWGRHSVHGTIRDGAVAEISVTVCDRHRSRLPESLIFMHQTFLRLVDVATGLFGEPAHLIDLQSQEVQWHLPNGSLTVHNARSSVLVCWRSRPYQDHYNDIAEVEARIRRAERPGYDLDEELPQPRPAPTRLRRMLVVRLRGTLDQERLTALRAALRMTRRGRLTDREDAEFGSRPVGAARLVLWRQADDHWEVSLHARPDQAPDLAVRRRLIEEVVAAAPAAGLTVEREEIVEP